MKLSKIPTLTTANQNNFQPSNLRSAAWLWSICHLNFPECFGAMQMPKGIVGNKNGTYS